ncbi:MAG: hypothetical protein LBM07_05000 [Culturomica sp.]|jgi:hypothetical protein|nr:hypothetical protein [Culturomica sp.]
MSNLDLIPTKDTEFNIFQKGVMTPVKANAEVWGVLPALLAVVEQLQTKWEEAFALAEDPMTRTNVAVQTKNLAREEYEKHLRKLIKAYLANNPLVTDEQRVEMGLPVYKQTHSPVPVPTSIPEVVDIDRNTVRRLTISFNDSESKKRAKPFGVQGAVVKWIVGGEYPTGIEVFTNSLLDTKSPITLTFTEQERDQTVYFALAWQNTKGEMGDFGEIHSVKVP